MSYPYQKKQEKKAFCRVSLAEYLISTTKSQDKPEMSASEIAFIGRSNVGKSSLINRLVQRKNLARVSGQPGKTRTINYYRIGLKEIASPENGREFLLVDLPGYGYAKVSREDRERWREFVGAYLKKSTHLAQVFMLVDIRHEPMESDLICAQFLHDEGIPFHVIATKSDKISKNQIAKQRRSFATLFDVDLPYVLATSAESGQGREELLERIAEIIRFEPVEGKKEEE